MPSPIVMCGIPRSGSTLLWQIFSALFPNQSLLKTHPDVWEPDGSLAVVSIRHPYDVVASLYRVRISRSGEISGGEEGLSSEIDRAHICFEALPKILIGPHMLFVYERFVYNHDTIYDEIENKFGIIISPSIRCTINNDYSIEANRLRASRMKNFNEFDEYGIHGDHIASPLPGSWRDILPEWAWNIVIERCYMIAKEWNYED